MGALEVQRAVVVKSKLEIPDFVTYRHPTLEAWERGERPRLPRLGGGAFQSWITLINAFQVNSQSSGTTYENSETLTDVSPGAAISGQALTIPAGFLVRGNILRFKACGWFSTKATPAAVEMGLYWGGVAGKALATTGKLKPGFTAAESNWFIEATTRITAAEEAGKAITEGIAAGFVTAGTETAGTSVNHMPASKPQTEIVINTATANILTMGFKFGEKTAEDKLSVTQWLVEILN